MIEGPASDPRRRRGGAGRSAAGRSAAGQGAGSWLAMYAVAVALRAAYAWVATGPHAQPVSDPAGYDAVAWNVARGAGFALGDGAGSYPTAFAPPVMPWITSLLYRVVGHDYFAALLLMCAIGALAAPLTAAFATRMFGPTAGRVGGWLATVHPLLVFFSGYLLTETPFTIAMLLALILSIEWVKVPKPGRAFGAGMAWGIATLARPTALLMPLLIAAWAWVPLGLTVPARERLRQLVLLMLALVLTVAPWTLRNAAVFHAFIPVTTGAGGALLTSNNAETWSNPKSRGGSSGELWTRLVQTEYRGLSETEVDARARGRAVAFLREHVSEWPAMATAKLARFWRIRTETGMTGSWQRPGSPLTRVLRAVDPLLAWSVVVLPLALWGVALSLRGARRWFQSLSLWVILYFTWLGVVFFGSLRMRVPVEPLVVAFAAAGLDDLHRRLRARRRGIRLVPAAER